jgi:hypothetical protein
MTRSMPSRSPTVGCQFRVLEALEMSGHRRVGSSTGSSSKTIVLWLAVCPMTVLASDRSVISSGFPD